MGSQPIRILSVEDHPVFREGLSTIIASQPDMILVSQATDAVEALSEFRRHRPDITLMDLRLAGTNGTDALVAIRGEYPQARIVILTTSDSDGEIQRAMRAGASGYILKSMPKNELLGVISGKQRRSVYTAHFAVKTGSILADLSSKPRIEAKLRTRSIEVDVSRCDILDSWTSGTVLRVPGPASLNETDIESCGRPGRSGSALRSGG